MVVVASLAQGRSSLAIGNIVGSAISNILGAFSLGLLFYEKGQSIEFDGSSRVYSIILLVVTTFVTPVTYFSNRTVWLAGGVILLTFFIIYIASIGVAISRGTLTAPEDSDDDSSDDDTSTADSTIDEAERSPLIQARTGMLYDGSARPEPPDEHEQSMIMPAAEPGHRRKVRRSLGYHIFYLILGFLAICLAGYVLSHAATTITDELGISDVLFGVIVLAIATTLPEKFVAVLSGHRGHTGILVANTAGSNVFLLALCAGIVMLDTSGKVDGGNVSVAELGVLWGSTLAFTLTVWFGARFGRWIGAVMLVSYLAFIILDFTVIHGVAKDT